MDYLEDYRLIKCLLDGVPTDMNVYDAAALSAVVHLTERSNARRSAAVDFPDFTRGRWQTTPPLGVVTRLMASGGAAAAPHSRSEAPRYGSREPGPSGCVESIMIISTTAVLDGRPVSRYLGIVTGEAIIGANIFRDMFAAVRDIVGGRSATYEKALAEARETALAEMQQRAQELGANAVIGVDLDYEVLGQNNGMLMVSCSGTAVVC